jgi:hypothetical protein
MAALAVAVTIKKSVIAKYGSSGFGLIGAANVRFDKALKGMM